MRYKTNYYGKKDRERQSESQKGQSKMANPAASSYLRPPIPSGRHGRPSVFRDPSLFACSYSTKTKKNKLAYQHRKLILSSFAQTRTSTKLQSTCTPPPRICTPVRLMDLVGRGGPPKPATKLAKPSLQNQACETSTFLRVRQVGQAVD